MRLIVARVGRAHGIRGEVTVEVRTDIPERRFVEGARLFVDPDGPRPPGAPKTLLLTGVRDHNGVLLLSFEGVDDRGAAEALRGVLLEAEVTDEDEEPDAWYDHQLVGLRGGRPVRAVASARSSPSSTRAPRTCSSCAVRTAPAELVPFVAAIVPTVDVGAGRVVIDAPGGLIDDVDDAEGRSTT